MDWRTGRQTKHKQRLSDVWIDEQAERQTQLHTERWMDWQLYRQTVKFLCRSEKDWQTDRQANTDWATFGLWMHRLTDRQIYRQINIWIDEQTDRHILPLTEWCLDWRTNRHRSIDRVIDWLTVRQADKLIVSRWMDRRTDRHAEADRQTGMWRPIVTSMAF